MWVEEKRNGEVNCEIGGWGKWRIGGCGGVNLRMEKKRKWARSYGGRNVNLEMEELGNSGTGGGYGNVNLEMERKRNVEVGGGGAGRVEWI